MHIERALIERIGDVGRKLHTARSRNDQIATDLRLWVREAIDRIDRRLLEVQKAFVGRCERDAGVILPGYTHFQRAQPILVPHYWLCYCEKYERDRGRLADCRKRVNVLSLGAAALAARACRSIGKMSLGGWDSIRWRPTVSMFRATAIRAGVRLLPGDDRRALEHLGRRVDFMGPPSSSISSSCRRRLHRLVDHAAEGQSRRARAYPRQKPPASSGTCKLY